MKPLDVYSDLSEQVKYNLADLCLYIKTDYLSRYGYVADCHWHSDLEFIYILDGTMDFHQKKRNAILLRWLYIHPYCIKIYHQ